MTIRFLNIKKGMAPMMHGIILMNLSSKPNDKKIINN